MIQAIETSYAGCRFRSRLEARWAVFFDAMGWSWEYEPEGFELGTLGRYLPDFLVDIGGKNAKQWIEIKGQHPTQHEIDLITELSWQTRIGASILYGQIELKRIDELSIGRNYWGQAACIAHYGRFPNSWEMVRPWAVQGYYEKLKREQDTESTRSIDPCRVVLPRGGDLPKRAAEMARSARFEHGEGRERVRRLEPLGEVVPIVGFKP